MKKYILTALGASLATILGLVCLGYFILGSSMENVTQLARFIGTMKFIESRYVNAVSEESLVNGAIDGMMKSLGDKHSVYMNQEKFKHLMEQNQGAFGGVGIVMSFPEQGKCEIMTVLEKSPGEAAGLLAKDEIFKVDGQEINGWTPEEIAQRIRGEEGSQVILSIRRKGSEDMDIPVTRAIIPLITAKGMMLEEGMGYIRLASFSENTAEEFKNELDRLKGEGLKGLILDLRANPGGLITSCVEIANEIIPAGEIVSMTDREGHRETFVSQLENREFPLVILIDENSASASEILAGAVKDRECGTLVGVKSFGKGSVQTMVPLLKGDGIKLTVAKYYTPSGASIDGIGIEPDVRVELPEGVTEDLQLNKAKELLREGL